MKATGILVCLLAAVALAAGLVLEHRACLRLEAQIALLRGQLAKTSELMAENERLTHLLAQAKAGQLPGEGNVATNGPSGELARLRSQVETLHEQGKEADNLRADTGTTREELKELHDAQRANQLATHQDSSNTNGAAFQILAAYYGTVRSNIEVSAELTDRIRAGSLKTVASNHLLGDPDFGQVKDLTIIYSYDGVIMTNQFQEGAIIILPPPGTSY